LTEPLLDWLRVEYAIAKPSNKLLAVTDLDFKGKAEGRMQNAETRSEIVLVWQTAPPHMPIPQSE